MEVIAAAEGAVSKTQTSDSSGILQLAMVLMAIGLVLLFNRWRRSRPQPVTRSAQEWRALDDDPDQYRSAKDKCLVEIEETGRMILAAVDTKIRILNALVAEAERQAAHLQELLDYAENRDTLGPGTGENTINAHHPDTEETYTPLQQRIIMLRDNGKNLAEIAQILNLSITEIKYALDAAEHIPTD